MFCATRDQQKIFQLGPLFDVLFHFFVSLREMGFAAINVIEKKINLWLERHKATTRMALIHCRSLTVEFIFLNESYFVGKFAMYYVFEDQS